VRAQGLETIVRSVKLGSVIFVAMLVGTPAMGAVQGNGTPKFYGRTVEESSPPAWPALPRAPKGAPNILLIMTDDVGFGSSSTFGGPVPTTTFDQLAAGGLRYNQFNTAAICSPTRAALLTVRNPQEVGVGYVTNWPTGYDGYNSVIPKSAGTVAQILKENGYNTAMFGKGHVTPEWEMSQAGPFDRWPTGLGFQYYYGFLGADTSEFEPTLVENTTPVDAPRTPNYHLDRDLADHAIHWIAQQKAAAPDRPFFIYYASGTAHAPNHAPSEWLDRFRGKFDEGWDKLREQIVAREKALGVVPANADDSPRPAGLPRWESLSPTEKHLAERHMEAFAASLAFADNQIGRVVDYLRRSGQFDNTLVIYIQGDNGASAEGSFSGRIAEQSALNGFPEPLDYAENRADEIGTKTTYPLNTGGWGWAMNAPFPWAKRYASHFGGTRNGMVISWPAVIKDKGGLRTQFHHVSDIMPTLLDVAGVSAPAALDGIAQQPITGISMRYTFNQGAAPSQRKEQVFAVAGNLSFYKDGWVVASRQAATPWDRSKAPYLSIDQRTWELYDTRTDFSEAHDLAAQNPGKVAQMKDLFWVAAARANILPIHPDEGGQAGRPYLSAGRTVFEYGPEVSHIPAGAAPEAVNRSIAISADVTVPQTGATGVLVADGGRFSGYALFLDQGRLTFTYNGTPPRVYRVTSSAPVPPGRHRLVADFKYDGGIGGPATLVLSLDGREIGRGRIEHSNPVLISHTEGLDVGRDSISPVDQAYSVETSKFTGQIENLTITLR